MLLDIFFYQCHNWIIIALILIYHTTDISGETKHKTRRQEPTFATRPGCSRPPIRNDVFQFINGTNIKLNDTQNVFFEKTTVLTPMCIDPGQHRLVSGSTDRVCQIWGQWSGPVPSCEPVSERLLISGDFDYKEVEPDGSVTITFSSNYTFVEVVCITSNGSPKLIAGHIDSSEERVEKFSRRGDTVGSGKGVALRPPVVADSGTFACRSVDQGTKSDHQLVINFQQSEPDTKCPNNITVNTEPGRNDAHVYWPLPDFPPGYIPISDHEPGSVFPIGSIQVHYYFTVADSSTTPLSCEFKVTIIDEEKPTIINCPEDISRSVLPGQNSVNVSWIAPDAWDNCGVVAFKPDRKPEGQFPIGKTDIFYEAFDCSGNSAYCNFTVSIHDNEAPVISNCPGNITINVTDPYHEEVIVTWIEPNITDNSGDFGINSSSIPGDTFEFGLTLVSYVAKDSSGNADFCDFYVMIVDDVPPWFIDCPDDIVHYTGDMFGSVVYWPEPRPADNADISPPVYRSHSPGDYLQEGVHHVQYIVRDTYGNDGLCEFNITVATAICPSENTNFSSVLLSWEQTPIDETTFSLERCSVYTTKAGTPLASRECVVNETIHGAQWQDPELLSCGEKRDTVDIQDLSQIPVVQSNVEEIAAATVEATYNTTTLEIDSITSVAETLENIVEVKSDSSQVTEAVVKTIDNVLDSVEEELDDGNAIAASSSSIVRSLEKQVSSTAKETGKFEATQPRVAVRTVQVKPEEMLNDITFVSFRDEVLQDENGFLKVNQVQTVIDDEDLKHVDTSITLPLEVRKRVIDHHGHPESNVHFSFILFQSDGLFNSERIRNMSDFNQNITTSGRVISALVEGPPIVNLSQPVVIEFSPHQAWNESIGSAECVFWDFTLQEGVGDWAPDGCHYAGVNDGRIVCHCYHLTSFAVLMDMSGTPSTGLPGLVLDLITKLGCLLSIAGLVLSLATLLALRSLRSSRSRQILIQLCFSLLCLYVIFLGGIEATGNNTVCLIIAALLHYFTLTTLAWMAVEARNMYLLLVRIFKGKESRFMMKACFFAWGTPTIIVTVCVALTVDEYQSQYHCFLRPGYPLYYGLMLPIGLILIHNFVTFGLVVKSLLPSNVGGKCAIREKRTKSKQVMGRLQNALVMSVLLGLTWAFGFLAIDKATFIFQLLFCICNSIQGLLVFLLFCLRSQDVRKAWKSYFPFECNIHGQSYKVQESSYGYHLRGSDAHAWHGPTTLGPNDGQGLEYYMYTNKDRPTSNGTDHRYTYTSQFSSNSNRRISVFSGNSQ